MKEAPANTTWLSAQSERKRPKTISVTLGIPASRITTITYGKELPVCQDHSEDAGRKTATIGLS